MKLIDAMKAKLEKLKVEAQGFLTDGKVDEAKAKMEEVKSQKEAIAMQEILDAEELEAIQAKAPGAPTPAPVAVDPQAAKENANFLRAAIKQGMGKGLTAAENALLVPVGLPTPGTDGVGLLLPQDIRTIIQKKIRQYRSLRDVLGYLPVSTMTGSLPVENFETVTELVDFTDGTPVAEMTDIKFTNVSFSLKEKGGFISLSNTLLSMTDNDLINYVADVFARKAVVTENKMSITALQAGKTQKDIADWKALSKSINVDIDEGVKYNLVIVTNQDGFDVLDGALDNQGRPVLQPDPTNPTVKRFKGARVEVYSNAMLPTTGTTTKKAPIFYGNLDAAVKMVDNGQYMFATSAHAGFTSNTTVARVITYLDVMKLDASDKIYIAGNLAVV
ncbi:phage major capsid protein [Paenibacillus sp. MAH-36]|uniref:Phage major capsid protein n=1 Tax=Paenibacillus violae TaxID=3077234 RepID=A0ABU3R7B6_9BACL|nr:phage major capsid protein [Paenibacillus sp. PFR10]MDU0200159.1 phage major capsid protein [Paenibacillus sp. PFR10]